MSHLDYSQLISLPLVFLPSDHPDCKHRITPITPQLKPLNSLPITCRIMPKFLCVNSKLLLLFLSCQISSAEIDQSRCLNIKHSKVVDG